MFRVRARQKKQTATTQPETKKIQPSDLYDDDTDLESDVEDSNKGYSKQSKTAAALPLPPLLDMFDNIKFYISDDMDKKEIMRLRRYIVAYKGFVRYLLF